VAAHAGAFGQPRQLPGGILRRGVADLQADQNRRLAVRRNCRNQASLSGSTPTLTAREGTTVEMACL